MCSRFGCLRDAFQALDTYSTGQLTLKSFTMGLQRAGCSEDPANFFRSMASNNSGTISLRSFLAYFQRQSEPQDDERVKVMASSTACTSTLCPSLSTIIALSSDCDELEAIRFRLDALERFVGYSATVRNQQPRDVFEEERLHWTPPPIQQPPSSQTLTRQPGLPLAVECAASVAAIDRCVAAVVEAAYDSLDMKLERSREEARRPEQLSVADVHKLTDGLQTQVHDLQAHVVLVSEALQAQLGEAMADRRLAAAQPGACAELQESLEAERRCCQRRLQALAGELWDALQASRLSLEKPVRRLTGCAWRDEPAPHSGHDPGRTHEVPMVRRRFAPGTTAPG